MKHRHLSPRQMTLSALMAATLCVLGPVSFPLGPVPVSLSTLIICLSAWLLGARSSTLSVALYLLLGAAGLPVFSGYGAGLSKIVGPTGGYLVGYLFLAFIGGFFIEKSHGQRLISAFGLVLGTAACYACGSAWFALQTSCTLSDALAVCVFPFLPFDLAKILLSCSVGPLVRRRLLQADLLF